MGQKSLPALEAEATTHCAVRIQEPESRCFQLSLRQVNQILTGIKIALCGCKIYKKYLQAREIQKQRQNTTMKLDRIIIIIATESAAPSLRQLLLIIRFILPWETRSAGFQQIQLAMPRHQQPAKPLTGQLVMLKNRWALQLTKTKSWFASGAGRTTICVA